MSQILCIICFIKWINWFMSVFHHVYYPFHHDHINTPLNFRWLGGGVAWKLGVGVITPPGGVWINHCPRRRRQRHKCSVANWSTSVRIRTRNRHITVERQCRHRSIRTRDIGRGPGPAGWRNETRLGTNVRCIGLGILVGKTITCFLASGYSPTDNYFRCIGSYVGLSTLKLNPSYSDVGIRLVLASQGWQKAWQLSPKVTRSFQWSKTKLTGRPQVSKCMECDFSLQCFDTVGSAGRQEGHRACKTGVGLLVVTIWLEPCMSYSSSCHHHLHYL